LSRTRTSFLVFLLKKTLTTHPSSSWFTRSAPPHPLLLFI
jgi:hypothetical protein